MSRFHLGCTADHLAVFCALLFLSIWTSARSEAQDQVATSGPAWRVAGYVPDYRLNSINDSVATQVTDLVVFSAEADASGQLNTRRFSTNQLQRLKLIKQRTRVGLILCVGGWERSKGFAAMSASATGRQRFVQEAIRFCLDQRFDGIDLDWEHPANDVEQQNYSQLLKDLKTAFQEHALSVSVTMAAWQQLPTEAFATVDFIQVMAYDHQGRHSTPQGAEQDLKLLLDRGAPPGKLILGLPFYGRGIKQPNRVMTYSEIVAKYAPAADVDDVDGVYFNSPRTLEKKIQSARSAKLGGVMIWELGQDAAGENSLLSVVRRASN